MMAGGRGGGGGEGDSLDPISPPSTCIKQALSVRY